jgi:hypothetical protein
VSPAFKQSLYPEPADRSGKTISPIDLFYGEKAMMIETFPLIQLMTVYEVTLTPGQCLFVPAFWWV